MSFSYLSDLNWLAVVVAAVAWFVLGAAWYSPPPMAKIWLSVTGMEMPEDRKPNPMVFLVTLVAYLICSVVVGVLVIATGTDVVDEAIVLGVMLGVGFWVAGALVNATYEMKPRPTAYVAFNGIYNLLAMVLVSVILTLM